MQSHAHYALLTDVNEGDVATISFEEGPEFRERILHPLRQAFAFFGTDQDGNAHGLTIISSAGSATFFFGGATSSSAKIRCMASSMGAKACAAGVSP